MLSLSLFFISLFLLFFFCFFLFTLYISHFSFFFFFNDTATTEIYTLSLHDALPISPPPRQPSPNASSWSSEPLISPARCTPSWKATPRTSENRTIPPATVAMRSEEHTSELQSPDHLVCRLLLEKKKK